MRASGCERSTWIGECFMGQWINSQPMRWCSYKMAVAPACKVIKCDTSARCLGMSKLTRAAMQFNLSAWAQAIHPKKREKKLQLNQRLELQVNSVVFSVLREKILIDSRGNLFGNFSSKFPKRRSLSRCKMTIMFTCLCLVKFDSPFLQILHSFNRAKWTSYRKNSWLA